MNFFKKPKEMTYKNEQKKAAYQAKLRAAPCNPEYYECMKKMYDYLPCALLGISAWQNHYSIRSRCIYANHDALSVTGYTLDELTGADTAFARMLLNDNHLLFQDAFRFLREPGHRLLTFTRQSQFVSKQGQLQPAHFGLTLYRLVPQRAQNLMMCNITHITDELIMSPQLEKQRAQLLLQSKWEIIEAMSLKETAILHLLPQKYTSAQIAGRIFLSEKTVSAIRGKMEKKLNLPADETLDCFACRIAPCIDPDETERLLQKIKDIRTGKIKE